LNTPVIVSAVRTAIAKKGGALKDLHPSYYGGLVISEAIKRVGVQSNEVDEVILGNCLSNSGNIARVALLEAGLDISVPGITIDRQCGSGINSVALAAEAIMTGGKIVVAGGTESMTNEPYLLEKQKRAYDTRPPNFLSRNLSPQEIGDPPMGITAENLAEKYSITPDEQNQFAFESQMKMKKAMDQGKFKEQILPISLKDKTGKEFIFEHDEHPRGSITLEALKKLPPVFKPGGTVTAGTSSGINDGASALVLMSQRESERRGLKPLGRVVSWAVAGVDPNIMGIGPVPAIQKLLRKTDLTLNQIDLFEINEAFAAQVIACHRELKFDMEKVNVNGGAIAHGHPIAATGSMLITKLLYELRDRGLKRGLVSACIGGGQGIALLIER
jgi:acetyl-CoA C-acetyltransferase